MPLLQRISFIIVLITFLHGCASLSDEVNHSSELPAVQQETTLSTLAIANQLDDGEQAPSGVVIQDTGWDALAQRLALIETAEQSIDIQYYIWNSDRSGRYLASRLIAAANRGVKVRIMLDDINLNEREDMLTALDAHPFIEIRVFNPIPTRRGVAKWLNVLGDFSRLNRRMHNKSFTVDGAMSVVGGRNIGDEYFDLSDDINFRDRDVLVSGAVVNDIQLSFVEYWDSRWSYPVSMLGGEASIELADLDRIYPPRYKHYPALPEGKEAAQRFLEKLMSVNTWVKARYVADQPVPDDVANTDKPKRTARVLADLALQSKQEIVVESAYLVFDDGHLDSLQGLTNDGVKVSALTNSMVSNDLITNHSGYAGRRQGMLEHGMQLFELKPETKLCEQSTKDAVKCAPTTPYGLHSKSVVFDRQIAAVGSFNFNLRSTYLNTESILVIDNESIADSLADDIEVAMEEENSWRLGLDDGNVRWYSGTQSWDSEPDTSQWDRVKSRFLQLFPIEKYL
ncbi:phospholipase D family protein [Photobacterium rosenbergii]|uniref:Phospholipase D family protein n=1 Tax=Photobacterium rosenbergii TaxID=294936 RepID=A0ABU3ZFM8_9GAMM|nr:phospholipase D family protein [Photobacterium rosenbergii]MDV5168918.1 phospholipase D family protein [Photobacterium rosenbergii]